jgi:predicted permease
VIAVVLICFVAGWAAQRVLPRPVEVGGVLDRIVFTFLLPALVLAKLPDVPLGTVVVVPALVAWTGIAIAALAVRVAARVRAWERHVTAALLLVTPLGNTSFLGLAAVQGLLGADHLGPALAFDQLGTFLGLAVYGSWVASRYGAVTSGWGSLVSRLVRFPPFVAVLVSLPVRWVDVPGPVDAVLDGLGTMVAPVAMFALGLRFRLVLARRAIEPAVFCLATKMLALPLLALGAAIAVGQTDDVAWRASVLQAGMPCMATAAVIATQSGFDAELATFVVGFGIVAAVVTLPLLALALG